MNRSHLQTRALLDALDKVDALLASRGTALVDSPDRRRLAGFFSSHSRPGFYAWAFTAAEYPDAIAAIARRAPDLVDRLEPPRGNNDFTVVGHCDLRARFGVKPEDAKSTDVRLLDGTTVQGASVTSDKVTRHANGLIGIPVKRKGTVWLFQPDEPWGGDAAELASTVFAAREAPTREWLTVEFPVSRTNRLIEDDWIQRLKSRDGSVAVTMSVSSGEARLDKNGFRARETRAVQLTEIGKSLLEPALMIIDGPFVAFFTDDSGLHAAAWFDRDSFTQVERKPVGKIRWTSAREGSSPSDAVRTDVILLPCRDSDDMAADRERELRIPRERAADLGRMAVLDIERGSYRRADGRDDLWKERVNRARLSKESISPQAELLETNRPRYPEMRIQVTNETTLGAARRLLHEGHVPVALNFANGVHPGGGFLGGARAQEECLCRSSALFATLDGDLMYRVHSKRPRPDSTDWTIYSPYVPVHRRDDGTPLSRFWRLSFLTCAAPYAPAIGQPEAGDLLQKRIHRVLAVARAFDHDAVVLGAWGCGAFGNDPHRTARDFRDALEGEFRGAFTDVVFAIADWSPERRFLGPFRDVFS